MTISSVVGDRQDVIALPGHATETTCNVVVAVRHISNSEPDIEMVVNGVTYTNTDVVGGALTHYGTDHFDGDIGPLWMGVIVVTGLEAFTRYDIAIDDTTNVTSNTGKLMTSPSENDDFCLFAGTCFMYTKTNEKINGMYSHMINYSDLPVAAYLHVDDIWYVDGAIIDDTKTNHDSATTGLQMDGVEGGGVLANPGTSDSEFNWAVGYLAGMGMLGPALGADFNGLTIYEYGVYGGRGEDKLRVNKEFNFMPQFGDHEFRNDTGWDIVAGTSDSFPHGIKLWNGLFGINGMAYGKTIRNNNTTAYGWSSKIGCVNVVAPDGVSQSDKYTIVGGGRRVDVATTAISSTGNPTTITLSSAPTTPVVDGKLVIINNVTTSPDNIDGVEYTLTKLTETTFTIPANVTSVSDAIGTAEIQIPTDYAKPPSVTEANLYSDDQILDILEALDTNEQFKLILLDKGVKYPAEIGGIGGGYAEIATGEQHPIKNHCETVYSNFVTKDSAHAGGQKSIMLNPKTNGANGVSFVVTGDHHTASVYENHEPSSGSDLGEQIISFNCGTVNGSLGNFTIDSSLVVGQDTGNENCTPHLIGDFAGDNHYWIIQIEVYGSRSPKEIHMKYINESETVIFHKKFIQNRGNFLYDSDLEVAAPVGSAAAESGGVE